MAPKRENPSARNDDIFISFDDVGAHRFLCALLGDEKRKLNAYERKKNNINTHYSVSCVHSDIGQKAKPRFALSVFRACN